MDKANQFELGMIVAAGIIFRSFDQPSMAFEILKEIHADKIDLESVDKLEHDVLAAYRIEVAEQAEANARWQRCKVRNTRVAKTWRGD